MSNVKCMVLSKQEYKLGIW